MIIALASPHVASSLNYGRRSKFFSLLRLVCSGVSSGLDFEVPYFDRMIKGVLEVAHRSSSFKIATIFGMERLRTQAGKLLLW